VCCQCQHGHRAQQLGAMWALCVKLGCCVRISLEPLLAAAPKDYR
jgi:hypothetical protein